MSRQVIVGSGAPNSGLGSPLRTAGERINANFTELYAAIDAGSGRAGRLPNGSTDDRPESPVVGMFRYNLDTGRVETYEGASPAWTSQLFRTGDATSGQMNFYNGVNGLMLKGGVTNSPPIIGVDPASSDTNVGLVLGPKGTGALVGDIPDSTVAGGDPRGANAVDFQLERETADQVASGSQSVLIGGKSSATAGTFAVGLGGYKNSLSGTYSIAIGGQGANAKGRRNRWLLSNGNFAAIGDAQKEDVIFRGVTTDATPSTINAFGSGAVDATTNSCHLGNNSAIFCDVLLVGRNTSTGDSASWLMRAVGKRGANAAATSIVGSVSSTKEYADAGASAWAATIVADTTNGSLNVQVTGAAATTIRWVAVARLMTVG